MRSCILLLVGALAASAAAVQRAGLAAAGELAYVESEHARGSASVSRSELKDAAADFGVPSWKRTAEFVDESKRDLVVDREEQGAGDEHHGQYKRNPADVEVEAIDSPGRWKRDDDVEAESVSEDTATPPGWRQHDTQLHAPGRWKRAEKAHFETEGAGDHFGHSAWK